MDISVAVSQLEVLLPKLTKMSPEKKMALLYKLREELDYENFREVAALFAINLSRGENPKRWSLPDLEEVVSEEQLEAVEDLIEGDIEDVEEVEGDEYLGQRVVERVWRSTI
ncbi:hypothetical protein Pogu_0457 [Pyrobaculum oguniense TE7]|uniref:Uncharacterized protein n=1 Tax=Pyrobaculum oguniense (strain DSM 13380 / JCM 10595 / TE7) TaxID=698757 RepID=H6Q7Q4_PYROT|nr:hypothetical protein Pogu_0457 [Pyrobaculum oguniense TE7]